MERLVEIRIARQFGRVDVDRFLCEITPKQFAEQVAYDMAIKQIQAERQAAYDEQLLR